VTRRGAENGGLAARRAVARWSWRLFRREWRQQVLVLTLITAAVAVTVAGAAAAYNMAPSGDAKFGRASHRVIVDGRDPAGLAVELDSIEDWFGTTEQIRTWTAPVPGSTEHVEIQLQDPGGPFGSSLLALRAGRYPSGDDQIALTDDMADLLGADVGSTVQLRDRSWTVVGLVEDPEDLGDEFALIGAPLDDRPETVAVLVDTTDERIRARPGSGRAAETVVDHRGNVEKATAALVVYLVATVVLLLVALVAAAGFVVMAQRRQRQIGLLVATGATDRHVRLALVANGAVVGAVAAVVGTAAGLLLWVAVAGPVEPAVGHRIDRFDVPWWVILVGMVLAVWTATAASWWPARAVSRLPVVTALSDRPPAPRPAHRSALLAGTLVALGTVAIWLSDPNRTTRSAQPEKDVALVAGVVLITFGVLFLGPIALRAAGRTARRLPVTGRLAVRDLARFQARSGMALGAVSLAIGIPIAIVITSTARDASGEHGNLSDRDLLFRIGGAEQLQVADPSSSIMVADATAREVAAIAAQVDRLARRLDGTAVLLEMAMDPGSQPRAEPGGAPDVDVRPAVAVGVAVDEDLQQEVVAYVATPGLLDHLGVDRGAVDGADVLTVRTEPLRLISMARRTEPEVVTRRARLDVLPYSSAPTTLVTPEAVRRHGWETVPVGWLVTAGSPLTNAEVGDAREVAAGTGMTVEARRDRSPASLRFGAVGAGTLLALGVVAMTVGLVRSETAGDLRTLTATGATGGMRRALTAWTAGTLALLGVALGGLGAYLALASGYARDLGVLGDVPIAELAVLAAGIPLLAAGAGWALGGREPSSLVRRET
jgi:putative ABC transport system permease protein